MSLETDIKAVLDADTGAGGVKTLCTGGIYAFEATERLGINRDSTPNAFDGTTGLLKPCCIIREREEVPDNGVRDIAVASVRQVVELWFYDDGDAAYTTAKAARARAFVLLDEQMIGTDKVIPRFVGNNINTGRDVSLDNALMLRADYEVRGLL